VLTCRGLPTSSRYRFHFRRQHASHHQLRGSRRSETRTGKMLLYRAAIPVLAQHRCCCSMRRSTCRPLYPVRRFHYRFEFLPTFFPCESSVRVAELRLGILQQLQAQGERRPPRRRRRVLSTKRNVWVLRNQPANITTESIYDMKCVWPETGVLGHHLFTSPSSRSSVSSSAPATRALSFSSSCSFDLATCAANDQFPYQNDCLRLAGYRSNVCSSSSSSSSLDSASALSAEVPLSHQLPLAS